MTGTPLQLELSEEQRLFRDSVRRFLEDTAGPTAIRDLHGDAEGFDRSWWKAAASIGWTAAFVPERLGGGCLDGRPLADAAIVAEEIGRTAAPGPFFPVVTACAALARSDDDRHADRLLPALLCGEAVTSWAFAEPGNTWLAPSLRTEVRRFGGDVVVTGEKAYVEALGSAENVVVSGVEGTGLTQVLVPCDAPGVTIVPGCSVDLTRRFGRMRLDEVRLPRDAVLGEPGRAAAAIEQQLHLGIALQCAELVGVADRTLAQTIAYGRDRIAFGRPIVSFQALKHRIADLVAALEGMKAVTEALVAAFDDDRPDLPVVAAAAGSYVGQRCVYLVDDCVQITGGLGVTWEHDIHVFSRRAILGRSLLGAPEQHRRHVLELVGKPVR